MPVDVSSYQQEQTSPFDTLGKLTSIQNQANQNKLFQQQYNSKLGLSQIYKNAYDPQTQQIDFTKIPSMMAGPDGQNMLLGLPEAVSQNQALQKGNLDIAGTRADVNQKHYNNLNSITSDLLNKDTITVGDVVGHLAEAKASGDLSEPDMLKMLQMIPFTPDGKGIDQNPMRQILQNMQMRSMSPEQRYNIVNPATQMVQTGQGQIPMQFPRGQAPQQVGGMIPTTAAPTDKYFDPSGQSHYFGNQGGGTIAPGTLASAPPGTVEAATRDMSANVDQGQALQHRADASTNNRAILRNLDSELGDFTSGPGTERLAGFEKFVNAQTGHELVGDDKKLAARERFNKLAAMLAQSQFQALGGTGTDRQLGSTELTSPNSELSKMGNRGIIAMLKGNEDAINVKNQEWQKYKAANGAGSYDKFSTQFNKNYDPRVFQGQYLTRDEKLEMLKKMPATEKSALAKSINIAKQNGWLTPNGQ